MLIFMYFQKSFYHRFRQCFNVAPNPGPKVVPWNSPGILSEMTKSIWLTISFSSFALTWLIPASPLVKKTLLPSCLTAGESQLPFQMTATKTDTSGRFVPACEKSKIEELYARPHLPVKTLQTTKRIGIDACKVNSFPSCFLSLSWLVANCRTVPVALSPFWDLDSTPNIQSSGITIA